MPITSPRRRRRQYRRTTTTTTRRRHGLCIIPLMMSSVLLFLLFSIIVVVEGGRFLSSSSTPSFRTTTNAARKMLLSMAERNEKKGKRGRAELDDDIFSLRSFPALNIQQSGSMLLKQCQDVSLKMKKRVIKLRFPPAVSHLNNLLPNIAVAPLFRSGGGFYGVSPTTVDKYYTVDEDGEDEDDGNNKKKKKKPKPPRMQDSMNQALDELRLMRVEMEALRRELHDMKQKVTGEEDGGISDIGGDSDRKKKKGLISIQERRKKQKRLREFESIASEVEKWAEDELFRNQDSNNNGDKASAEADNNNNGWVQLQCNKMFEQTFNSNGQTSAYIKWMKDSRGKYARTDDNREYPCIRVYSTIDAPCDEVCMYLSQSSNIHEYNDLIVKHKDLEVLSPHSKICWGQTPKILFIKPRDMVTFCQHRWLRDGSQLVINQAYDDDYDDGDDGSSSNGKNKKVKLINPNAYALRGANVISPHPDDPNKTQIRILCHANPGDDVPQWATKTAANSLMPIEPFKLFHKINQGVLRHREELQKKCQLLQNIDETEMVSSSTSSADGNAVTAPDKIDGSTTSSTTTTSEGGGGGGKRISRRPAGLSQLGYACFWPDGGGIEEGGSSRNRIQMTNMNSNNESQQQRDQNEGGQPPVDTTNGNDQQQQQMTSTTVDGDAEATSRAQDRKNVDKKANTNSKKEAVPSS